MGLADTLSVGYLEADEVGGGAWEDLTDGTVAKTNVNPPATITFPAREIVVVLIRRLQENSGTDGYWALRKNGITTTDYQTVTDTPATTTGRTAWDLTPSLTYFNDVGGAVTIVADGSDGTFMDADLSSRDAVTGFAIRGGLRDAPSDPTSSIEISHSASSDVSMWVQVLGRQA